METKTETTITVMLSLDSFDPTSAALTDLVAETAGIVEVNLEDKTALEKVKAGRIKLRDARVALGKTGKAMREDATAFAKAVIAKEKELIAIIEPEEERLAEFERQAAALEENRIRIAQLPERKQRLADAGIAPIADEVLLTMTSLQFEHNFNALVAEKNAADQARITAEQNAKQAELDKKEADLNAEQKRIDDEKLAKERETAAAEQAVKDEQARVQREADEKAAADAETARLEAEATAKRERADRYKAFRVEHGWTEETVADFYEKVEGDTVTLFKKVGEFDLSLIK